MAQSIETASFLVAEDHPLQREMLGGLLRSMGAVRILTAADGAQAMRILRESPVDVMVSDVKMPVIDAFELIPLLARHAPNVSLLLLSADAWTLEIGRLLAEGHHIRLIGAVQKPITPAKLELLLKAHFAAPPRQPTPG